MDFDWMQLSCSSCPLCVLCSIRCTVFSAVCFACSFYCTIAYLWMQCSYVLVWWWQWVKISIVLAYFWLCSAVLNWDKFSHLLSCFQTCFAQQPMRPKSVCVPGTETVHLTKTPKTLHNLEFSSLVQYIWDCVKQLSQCNDPNPSPGS